MEMLLALERVVGAIAGGNIVKKKVRVGFEYYDSQRQISVWFPKDHAHANYMGKDPEDVREVRFEEQNADNDNVSVDINGQIFKGTVPSDVKNLNKWKLRMLDTSTDRIVLQYEYTDKLIFELAANKTVYQRVVGI